MNQQSYSFFKKIKKCGVTYLIFLMILLPLCTWAGDSTANANKLIHDVKELENLLRDFNDVIQIGDLKQAKNLSFKISHYLKFSQGIQQLSDRIKDLESQVAKKEDALKKAQADLESSQSQVQEIQTKLDDLQARLTESKSKVDAAESRLMGRQSEIRSLQFKLDSCQSSLRESQREVSSLKLKLSESQFTPPANSSSPTLTQSSSDSEMQ
ncbi:MAG: hypothetical protein HYS07_08110 [Chlamydiae bacterium]|nr:hypothetical protein [Chlamydiota bacterium]MBI3277693.1 hypothetical protein [Chlamydiota bacterium]